VPSISLEIWPEQSLSGWALVSQLNGPPARSLAEMGVGYAFNPDFDLISRKRGIAQNNVVGLPDFWHHRQSLLRFFEIKRISPRAL
jgi:hypothetical protein